MPLLMTILWLPGMKGARGTTHYGTTYYGLLE